MQVLGGSRARAGREGVAREGEQEQLVGEGRKGKETRERLCDIGNRAASLAVPKMN